jgi:hypothetical protein
MLQRVFAIGKKRILLLDHLKLSVQGLAKSSAGLISQLTDAHASLEKRDFAKTEAVDPRTSSCLSWVASSLGPVQGIQVFTKTLQDDVLRGLIALEDNYCGHISHLESGILQARQELQGFTDVYVQSYQNYLDSCEVINTMAQSADTDPTQTSNLDQLRAECTEHEAHVIQERANLTRAKREYALKAEQVILAFEDLEKSFSATMADFAQAFGVLCDGLGTFYATLTAEAQKAEAAFPKHIAVKVAERRLGRVIRPPQIEFDVFSLLSWEKVFTPIFAIMRVSKATIVPEWKEFVAADKGDILLIIEEGVGEAYVRNENTGFFGLIPKSMMGELTTAGKKMVRKVIADVEGYGLMSIKKDQYVIVVARKDNKMKLCHNAFHELGMIPKAKLKKP